MSLADLQIIALFVFRMYVASQLLGSSGFAKVNLIMNYDKIIFLQSFVDTLKLQQFSNYNCKERNHFPSECINFSKSLQGFACLCFLHLVNFKLKTYN